MKEEFLKELRDKLICQKAKQKENVEKREELKQLEQNPLIQQYIALKEEVSHLPRPKSEAELFHDIYYKIHIKNREDTNEIYYCFGTFKNYPNKDGIRVERDDPKAKYRVYINIETNHDIKIIPVSECQEFEETHLVIYSSSFATEGEKEYRKIQKEFFLSAINEGQEQACQKILSRNKKMPK